MGNCNADKLSALKRACKKPAGFAPEAVAIANATSRNGGAVGNKALVPKLVKRLARKGEKILDFGAGKAAAHAKKLERCGHNVTAHEFGENVQEGLHDPQALAKSYDVVYASNVLNVQSTPEMLAKTVGQIAKATKDGGTAIANFPDNPRKHRLNSDQVIAILKRRFRRVEQVAGTEAAPVLKMTK